MSYDFATGEGYGLSEEAVQIKKRVTGVAGIPTTLPLTAVQVICL